MQGIDGRRLKVGIEKSIVKEKVIPVSHRRDPAIRKKPRQRAHRKFAERQALLPGKRLKIFGHRRIPGERHPGIDDPREEKGQSFPSQPSFFHRGLVSLITLGPDQDAELPVHRVLAAQIQGFPVIGLQFMAVIAINAQLRGQLVRSTQTEAPILFKGSYCRYAAVWAGVERCPAYRGLGGAERRPRPTRASERIRAPHLGGSSSAVALTAKPTGQYAFRPA